MEGDADAELIKLLKSDELHPENADEKVVVFVSTIEGSKRLCERLNNAGINAGVIHGDLEQRERTEAVKRFKAATKVLVGTDVL